MAGTLALRMFALLAAGLMVTGCDAILGTDDQSAPAVTIAGPAAAATLHDDSVRVTGSAEDDRHVERVTYVLDGGAEQPVEVGGGRRINFGFMVRGLAAGEHTLETRAYDAAGNRGSATVRFRAVDAVGPVVAVQRPADGLVWRDSAVVRGVARDDRGIAKLFFQLDAGAEVPLAFIPGKEVTFAVDLKTTSLAAHRLLVVAEDASGNRGVDTLRFTTAGADIHLARPSADTTLSVLALEIAGKVEHSVPLGRVTVRVNRAAEQTICDARVAKSWEPCGNLASSGRHDLLLTVGPLPQGASEITVSLHDRSDRRVGATTVRARVEVPARRYSVTYLGTLGGQDSRGTALNEKGQVVGFSTTASGARHAFFWDAGRMSDLGEGLGPESAAVDVNVSGEVVGIYNADCPRSFYWRVGQAGPPVRLGSECHRTAAGINDAGTILVGVSGTPAEGYLVDDGKWTRLVLDDYRFFGSLISTYGITRGGFINDRGQVLASLNPGQLGAPVAWLHPDRSPTVVATGRYKYALDLSDNGEPLVNCESPACAGLMMTGGRWMEVTGLGSRGSGSARSVNARAQVIGTYSVGQSTELFVWEGGQSIAVMPSDPAWDFGEAVAINDAGVILAHGRNTATGRTGALLLTPMP